MANEEVKEMLDGQNPENPEGNPDNTPEVDFAALLEGVDIDKLLQYDAVAAKVKSHTDKKVSQGIATAKTKWEKAQEAAKVEAK